MAKTAKEIQKFMRQVGQEYLCITVDEEGLAQFITNMSKERIWEVAQAVSHRVTREA